MSQFNDVLDTLVVSFNRLFLSGEMVLKTRDYTGTGVCVGLLCIAVLVGALLALFGYKIAKYSMVVTSLGIGFTLGFGIVNPFLFAHIDADAQTVRWLIWIVPVIVSVAFTILMFRFIRFAFFAIGGLCGFYVGHWISSMLVADTIATILIVAVCILLLGFLVMFIRKVVLRGSLSVLGAILSSIGVAGFFTVGGLPGAYFPAFLITFVLVVTGAVVYAIFRKRENRVLSRFNSFETEE